MPIFDYRCSACDAVFEQLVRGSAKVSCPSCESRKVERLMSLPARPAGSSAGAQPDLSRLGPPPGGGGCCGGGCHSHSH
jgi:putative FmdB family regulatory protein